VIFFFFFFFPVRFHLRCIWYGQKLWVSLRPIRVLKNLEIFMENLSEWLVWMLADFHGWKKKRILENARSVGCQIKGGPVIKINRLNYMKISLPVLDNSHMWMWSSLSLISSHELARTRSGWQFSVKVLAPREEKKVVGLLNHMNVQASRTRERRSAWCTVSLSRNWKKEIKINYVSWRIIGYIFDVVAFDDWPLILKTPFIAFFILLILYLCKREKYNRLWKGMY